MQRIPRLLQQAVWLRPAWSVILAPIMTKIPPNKMKALLLSLAAVGLLSGFAQYSAPPSSAPEYTSDGQLKFPEAYREWVYVTTGFDMSYNPAMSMDHHMFDNVFVNPEAYKAFMETGTWPDKTMLVLEVRPGESKGSINQAGSYQAAGVMGVEVHVKDEARFPGKWAFFGFDDNKTATAKMIPTSASCYSCHAEHAAVDTTFVQFYPTLLPVAYDKGTINPSIHLAPDAARISSLAFEHGWAAAESTLNELRASDPKAEALSESSLNLLGYGLLRAGKTADAVSDFEFVARQYPASPNAYDSLADGYLAAGNSAKALESSRKTLALLSKTQGISSSRREQLEKAANERIAKIQAQNKSAADASKPKAY